MGRDKEYPLTPGLESNLAKLLEGIAKLEALYPKPLTVSSGYRPGKYNKAAGGTLHSAHLVCEAVDLHDRDGEIKKFCTIDVLEKCGLYMESPHRTPTWCHVQVRPTKARIFIP